MSTPKRRAFFYPGPTLSQPGADQVFIPFGRAWQWLLQAEAQASQRSIQVIEVVAHTELALDDLSNSAQGPAVVREASREGATPQHASQRLLFGARQTGWQSRRFAAAQGTQSTGPQALGPIADRRSAHAQAARNFSLRQPACSQKASAGSSAFFDLFTRQVLRFPFHASK